VHAACAGLGVLCLIGGAATGVLVVFGVGGLSFSFAGVAGFLAGRTLIRGRGPILDGYVGDDQYVDGAPIDAMNSLALYVAIAGGLFVGLWGLAFGLDQVLAWLGR